MPQYRPQRPHVLHVGRSPALVVNAETCAHVSVIARFGAHWFRELGTPASPGSTLVSVSGAVSRPTVLAVALGTPLRTILHAAGADADPQALLTGGYGGAWLSGEHLDVAYANEALRPLGAAVGAGILVVVPKGACGLAETHRIVKWMANESSRQCGPCAFGLPALADDLRTLLQGSRDPHGVLVRLKERCAVIDGRGACRHPDGVVRLVDSALRVFARHVDEHVNAVPCAAMATTRRWVAVPALEHESDLVWE
jgi:NADH:ubiquinone oxidoreductase subunit F (NADH-binding)